MCSATVSAHRRANKPLHGRPAPHLDPGSAAKSCHPAQIATADFVHLHDSDAELNSIGDYNGAMGGGPGGSAALVRASLAATQQQKPKTVSRGWAGPAGRRAWRGQHREGVPRSPPIEARTQIPSALAPTPTSAPSQPSAKCRGRHRKPSTAPASSAQGLSSARGWCGGRRTSQTALRSPTRRTRPQSYPYGPSPAHPSGG